MIEHNLLDQETEVRVRLEKKIKAIVQQYNNRMIENKLKAGSSPDAPFIQTSNPRP
jgi:hypothetical protein